MRSLCRPSDDPEKSLVYTAQRLPGGPENRRLMAQRPLFEIGEGNLLPHRALAELPTPVEYYPDLA